MSRHDNQTVSQQNSACVIVAARQSSPRRDRQNGHPDCRCFPIQIVALHCGDKGESGQLSYAWDCHQPATGRGGPCHAPYVGVDRGDRSHHGSPRRNQPSHGRRETSDSLACSMSVVDEGGGERAGQSDPEHDRETTDLIFEGHSLAHQLLACADQRTDGVRGKRPHMDGLEEAVRANAPDLARRCGLLFQIVADSIGLCGRAPAHYLMLKNSFFHVDHNSGDRRQPRRKIPYGFGGPTRRIKPSYRSLVRAPSALLSRFLICSRGL